MELERRLAEFKKVEAVVVFQSGFAANAGTVSAILTKDDVVISDELNHASIIDGCRLSRAAIKVFPHKDVEAARRIITELPADQRKLLITRRRLQHGRRPGPAAGAVRSWRKTTGCIMMVDDAHASGVFGANGRGTIDHFGMHGRVDIQVGTLSKAMGALGGYVAGNRNLIEFLYHRARPFLFSTSHPPAVAATCIAALDVLIEEPEIIERLWDNTRFFKAGLERLGFNTGLSESPITPVIAGDSAKANEAVGSAVRGGSVRAGHRLPDRGQGQGARPDDRHRDPHPRRSPVRAGCVFESRTGARPRLIHSGSKGAGSVTFDNSHRRDRTLARTGERSVKGSASDRARQLFDTYTRDISLEELQRLFTHDTADAYRFFTRGQDEDQFAGLPLVEERAAARARDTRRVHAQAAAGPARALHRGAHHRARRDHPAVSRIRMRSRSPSASRSSNSRC